MQNSTKTTTDEEAVSKLIEEWKWTKTEADKLKKREMELRKQFVGTYFEQAKEGVNNLKIALLGGIAKLKFTNGMRRTLINDNLSEGFCDVFKYMNDDAEAANKFMEGIVRLKPSLDVKFYKGITDPELKRITEKFIETKPSSPVLTIELEA